MRMTAILTGATGYIGRHLLHLWQRQGDMEVICLDRSTHFDFAGQGWAAQLPERRVDLVVHLAQSRRYREFPDGAQDMFQVNVASTATLLEWARRHEVQRFVFASSGTVYVPRPGKLAENAERAPASMYAATKLAAELLLEPYREFFETVVARLFGVYGPGLRRMLIADTVEKVRTGAEIRLTGGAGIYITPLFIQDCAKVLNALARARLGPEQRVVNVAGDEILSLSDIVREVGAELDRKPVVTVTDGVPVHLCGDNARLRTLYEEPFLPFRQGLALTLHERS